MAHSIWPMTVLLLLAWGCSAEKPAEAKNGPAQPGLEPVAIPEAGIQLQKPVGWAVSHQNGSVLLAAPGGWPRIFFVPLLRTAAGSDALSFLRFAADQASATQPGFQLTSRRAGADRGLAEATARFPGPGGRSLRGLYLVSIRDGRGLYCGYEASEEQFDPQATLLHQVLPTFRVEPVTFDRAGSSPAGNNPRRLEPTIDPQSLTVRPSSDGSMFVAIPPDWQVGGGNIALAANSPDQKLGLFLTNDHSGFPSNDTDAYFNNRLIPFLRAGNVRLAGKAPNQEVMEEARSQGLAAISMNYQGTATSAEGTEVQFLIVVSLYRIPQAGMNGWVSCAGIFGVPGLFERNRAVLESMVRSISPNQSLILSRQRQALNRLAQASRTISETGEIVAQTLEAHRQGTDRIIDKYNYHLAGEEARYSALENRIYVVDEQLGQWATNPNYPQETLTEVPDQLWNRLEHERRP